jgi:CRP-like cAMP-binding protein
MITDLKAGMPDEATSDKSIIAHFSDGLSLNYSDGETIISDFGVPDGVFYIKSGFIKSYSVSHAGYGNLLFIHQAGEFIPLPWALDGDHITGLSYVAMSDVTVLRTSKANLRMAMGHDAWLSQEILKQAVEVIAVYTQRIQTLEFRTARGRIISELLSLSQRFGEKQGGGVIINAPITHLDIADSINLTRETASKTLGVLFESGLLAQNNHVFSIPDLAKFQKALR